jgi:predicted ferric reductase
MYGLFSIVLTVLVTFVLFILARIVYPSEVSIWLLLAKMSGLLGSTLISWNFLISTKNKYVEKLFGGLDRAYKIHNIIGDIAFILVVNHPVFLMINSLPFNTTKIYLVPSLSNLPYAFGILALYTLILLLALTIFIDLPYRFWKKTHEFMGIVIILASLHSLYIISDISVFLPLMLWILSLNLIGVIAYVYKRFIYYYLIPRENYIVQEVTRDKSYLLLTLTPQDTQRQIIFNPGQFAFFALSKDIRDDHPFSVLEQGTNVLKIGTKVIGNFTNKLSQLTSGTKISVVGPFGSFAANLQKANRMIWISGGIGITPFLSMMKVLRDDQEVTMVHTSRSDESKLFSNLFSGYSKLHPNFRFINHYSDVSGHINEEMLGIYTEIDSNTYAYICGPSQMMKDLSKNLHKKGILQKRIIFEDFRLKD